MSIEKILDDYKLVIIEGLPVKRVSNGVICTPKEITREDFLKAVGNETFGEFIKWEDKKETNVTMRIESEDLITGEKRYFKIYWKRTSFYFEG